MFLTLCVFQLLGYFVIQPVEEKVLLLLDPNFACIESFPPIWLPCLLTEDLKPLYLPKRAAGHSARWEARKWPLQAFPHLLTKQLCGLFLSLDIGLKKVQSYVGGCNIQVRLWWDLMELGHTFYPCVCSHTDGTFCLGRCEFLLMLCIWI